MNESPDETILAQEQAVEMRGLGLKKELEAGVGTGAAEGTLVLTDRRLVFVTTNEKEEDVKEGFGPLSPTEKLLFSDVESLRDVPDSPRNTSILLSSITSATGHPGGLRRPKLEVHWTLGAGETGVEFTEVLTGKRKRNLNDWAVIIQKLKQGEQGLRHVQKAPPLDTLEGKVTHVLSDMQEKGLFSIEEEVEEKFSIELDPDQVQASCDDLVKEGVLDKIQDPGGDAFYRRRSPLGEDDFSS